MRKARVEGISGPHIGTKAHYLVQFGQASSHDGEVGGRLSHVLDSLHKEAIHHLMCNDMFGTLNGEVATQKMSRSSKVEESHLCVDHGLLQGCFR